MNAAFIVGVGFNGVWFGNNVDTRLITHLHIRYVQCDMQIDGGFNMKCTNASTSSLTMKHLYISSHILYISQRIQYEIV